jgi:hypothetical protein
MSDNYDKEYPILSFRVGKDIKKKVDKIVHGRKKYDSEFSRQKYLYHLLEIDLEKLEML